MKTNHMWLSVIAAIGIGAAPLYAQVNHPGWIPSDRVLPAVQAEVSFNTTTNLWRYVYTFANGAGAEQPIQSVDFVFNAPAVSVVTPANWWGTVFADAPLPGATFAAEGSESFVTTSFGPAPAQPAAAIAAGTSLSGFVVESAYPPGYARIFVKGYAPVPYLPDDFPEATNTPDDTTNAARGMSIGPVRYALVVSDGNRRPAVDGFLAFLNVNVSGSTLTNPAPLALKFAINGETVDRTTFQAELNGVDVTASFHPGPADGADLTAYFAAGSSPLQIGKNVLITKVTGLVPGTTRTAIDTDRIVFTVQ